MNRFFRTAFATTLVYLCMTLFVVLFTRARMPFLAFSCLYFGLLFSLLPSVSQRLIGKERLFFALGAITAVLGFLPLVLWHCPMIHWVVHLLGIAVAGKFLSIYRHRTTYYDFMAKFQFALVALSILIGFVCLSILSGIFRDGDGSKRTEALSLALNNIVPFVIILLASGVLLLRSLRGQAGMVDEQAFNRRQLRDTVIFAILVTLVFVTDPFVMLQKVIRFLYRDVLQPAFRFLVQFVVSLLRSVYHMEETAEDPLPSPELTPEPRPLPGFEPVEVEPEQYKIEGNDLTLTVAYIFIAVAVLVLLVILAVQIRKLIRNLKDRNRSRGSGYPNETREKIPTDDEISRKNRPKKRNKDPRLRMRYLYAEFLRYLRKLQIRFSKADTCGEIQLQARMNSVADLPTLSDFTELYEQARYNLKETPKESEVRTMKNLLDRIRKK